MAETRIEITGNIVVHHPVHQCEAWQLLEHADGGLYCGTCGEVKP